MDEPDIKLGMAGYVVSLVRSLARSVNVHFYGSFEADVSNLFSGIYSHNTPGKKTIRKHRYYVGPHMVTRIDQDCYEPVSVSASGMAIGADDIVVCSDYQKGVRFGWGQVDPGIVRHSIYDPHVNTQLHELHGFSIITPNEAEHRRLTRQARKADCDTLLEYIATKDAMERNRYVAYTKGAEGVFLETWDCHTRSISVKHVPPLGICRDRVVDIVGAGDCVVAGMAVGLARGSSIEKSLIYGMAVAEVAIQQKGTVVVTAEDLRRVTG
jgi:bifunctional ADP-heptose synthase (sugar kinase/adenylyltransferase)